jgi:hypothetical protein
MSGEFVKEKYLKENGYDKFIEFLVEKYKCNQYMSTMTVQRFIEANIEYQEKTGWNRFIGISNLINFEGGIKAVIEIAQAEYGYNIEFIENEANVIDFIEGETLSINKVEYSKITQDVVQDSGNEIKYEGKLSYGHDGELYITTKDGEEYNLTEDLIEKGILGDSMGDETEVEIIIKKVKRNSKRF